MALRVLAQQAVQPVDGNPYITALYDAVRSEGAEVTVLTRREMVLGGHDVLHFHWPEQVIRWQGTSLEAVTDVLKVLCGIFVARLRGGRLVWSGHDLGPHDMPRPRLYRAYIAAFMRMVDLVICLSEASIASLHGKYPSLREVPVRLVPHGHYRDAYPTQRDWASARAELGLPSDVTVYLMLGQLRRYKAVPTLIEAFGDLGPEAHLVVAGRVVNDDRLTGELEEAATAAGNVSLFLERIPSAEISTFHAAADVVVLPYAEGTALHSGATVLALSMDTPVVVRDSGTMQELRTKVGPEWLRTFTGDVRAALGEAESLLGVERQRPPDLSTLEWDLLGRQTVAAFEQAADRRGPGPA